jgi:hypothetical protein
MLSSGYISKYFFGATNGRCGFTNPTARKNGLSFTSPRAVMALVAVLPSGSCSSSASAASQAGPFARRLICRGRRFFPLAAFRFSAMRSRIFGSA